MLLFHLTFFLFLSLNSNDNLYANNICEKTILKVEQNLNIPKYLLFSIALTESGRSINGRFTPWPWSINTKGKGMFFSTKRELVSYANKNLKKGIRNFDVGCMQVNYYYHGKKFKNLEDMADPTTNINWAGRFLIDLHKRHKNWKEAISRYHSNTKWRKHKYFKKVMNNWSYARKNLLFEVALAENVSMEERIINKTPKNKKKLSNIKVDKKIYDKNANNNSANKVEEMMTIEKSNEKNMTKSQIKIVKKDNGKEISSFKTSKYEHNTNVIRENENKNELVNQNILSESFSKSTIRGFQEIRLSEMEKKSLEEELNVFLPQQVSEILFINEFKYMETSTIIDNLKRIEEYKKER